MDPLRGGDEEAMGQWRRQWAEPLPHRLLAKPVHAPLPRTGYILRIIGEKYFSVHTMIGAVEKVGMREERIRLANEVAEQK